MRLYIYRYIYIYGHVVCISKLNVSLSLYNWVRIAKVAGLLFRHLQNALSGHTPTALACGWSESFHGFWPQGAKMLGNLLLTLMR